MIVLIGGTGFLGKHLCELLHKNEVPAVTFSRSPDQDFLREYAPSIQGYSIVDGIEEFHKDVFSKATSIVYLASQSFPGVDSYDVSNELYGNIADVISVLSSAVSVNPKIDIKYLSSGGTVYGPKFTVPIAENAATNPITPYAFGKISVENYIRYLANTSGCTYTIFRVSNPVGRWHKNPEQGFIGASLKRLATGEPICLFGDGSVVRDYVDADEVAESILMSLQNAQASKNKTWNVGSGEGHSLAELISIIEKITESKIEVNRLPHRNVDLPYNVLDCSLIKRELGWSANKNIDCIIKDVWERFPI